jgi:hypothetical protein
MENDITHSGLLRPASGIPHLFAISYIEIRLHAQAQVKHVLMRVHPYTEHTDGFYVQMCAYLPHMGAHPPPFSFSTIHRTCNSSVIESCVVMVSCGVTLSSACTTSYP